MSDPAPTTAYWKGFFAIWDRAASDSKRYMLEHGNRRAAVVVEFFEEELGFFKRRFR